MSTVVYLIEQPLDERNFERFGIQAWINRGWHVEVWDLTPLAHRQIWRDFHAADRAVKMFDHYFPMFVVSDLTNRVSVHRRVDYFIDLCADHSYSCRAKSGLLRLGAQRIIWRVNSVPDFERRTNNGIVAKLRNAFRDGPSRLAARLVSRVRAASIRLRETRSIVVVSGRKSLLEAEQTLVTHRFIHAHNLDYDIYLELRRTPASSAEFAAGGVFVDQDLCSHPDFIHDEIPFYVSPERYFPSLCRGLKQISESLQLEFVVAAHPRSSYSKRRVAPFGALHLQYGRTGELIRDCKVVVCHASAAIQFAVLFRKPVIFVTTNEMLSSPMGDYVARFAALLGKSVINLDGELGQVNWQDQMRIDESKYAAYIDEFVKMTGSADKPFWEIIIDHVESEVLRPAGAMDRQRITVRADV